MLRFTLFRIPISIHWLFWLLAAFLGGGVGALESGNAQALALVAVFMAAATFSILAHELGHALVGLQFGAPRAEIQLHGMGGQASFPGASLTATQRALMTAAGPGASLAVALIASVLVAVVVGDARPTSAGEMYLFYFLKVLVVINFFWTAVNLMPALPLDGGQILMALLGPARLRLTCIISFVTVAAMALGLWFYTKSIFNMLVMAFLASYTMQVWQSTQRR